MNYQELKEKAEIARKEAEELTLQVANYPKLRILRDAVASITPADVWDKPYVESIDAVLVPIPTANNYWQVAAFKWVNEFITKYAECYVDFSEVVKKEGKWGKDKYLKIVVTDSFYRNH